MMFRYVVNRFRDETSYWADSFYTPDGTTPGRRGDSFLPVRVVREQEACGQQHGDTIRDGTNTFFFATQLEAERFAETQAGRMPNWTWACSEVSQVFVSEKPKVIKKQVNEKGVLPL